MVDRQVHGVRNSGRRYQGDRLGADAGNQDQDSGPQRCPSLWHRCRGPEEENQGGRRLCPFAGSSARAAVIVMDRRVAEGAPERDRPTDVRQAQVWACLQGVTDPELDESVVDLNFVTRADVDPSNRVHIEFRLPTYWCVANFSFLMADDMRQAVSTLDWVEGVSVVLGEHMYADKINEGLAKGLSFQETFGVEADGSLDDLRQTFLLKAFQRRQVALLNHLTGLGHQPDTIVGLTLAGLESLSVDDEGDRLVRR